MAGQRRGSIAGLAMLATAVATVGTAWRSTGRPIAAPLQGNELLVQLEKVTAGAPAGGIYAVAVDGNVVPVLTGARFPVWSHSHRLIAFERDWLTGVADLDLGNARDLRYVVKGNPPLDLFSIQIAQAIQWLPDDTAVIRWYDGYGQDPAAGEGGFEEAREALLLSLTGEGAADRLIRNPPHSIGRVSFAPDGNTVAYEAFRMVRDIGTLAREVWLLDRRSGANRRLDLPGINALAVLNPHWSPTDARLAVDYYRPDLTRSTVICDTGTAAWAPVPPRIAGQDWMVSFDWSPDGTRLLVAMSARAEAAAGVNLVTVATAAGKRPQVEKRLPTMEVVYDCRWSPTGNSVAYLTGMRPSIPTEATPYLQVLPLGEAEAWNVPVPPGLRPVCIDW